jgi:hydroxyacylglutathione hydrolase
MKLIRISLGGVGNFNSYLITNENDFILIDTGVSRLRKKLVMALEQNNCTNKNLKYIILTNGTMDSIGNAKYISSQYNAKLVIHEKDREMVENNIFHKRQFTNKTQAFIYEHFIKNIGIKMSVKIERFTPDIVLNDTKIINFGNYPITILHTPGFTMGSICVLLEDKLLSGNTIINMNKSFLPPFVFTDFKIIQKSINELLKLPINMIYPGMGVPFPKELLK